MDAALNWQGRTPMDAAQALRRLQAALVDELEAAAEEIALRIERTAARLVNVDTGRLRASIDHLVERIAGDQLRVAVGSNVEYAPYQEVIDPYLRPAIEEHLPFIEERVQEAVQNAWGAVIR